jgi:acetylornithine deacetylase/succinyl-diaminopimelate desuccinylase-like protein
MSRETPEAYVQREAGRLVSELRSCCEIPSISAEGGPALAQMADWLTARLDSVLDEVRQVPVPGAPPAVIGRMKGTGPATILLYSHYDVQPAGAPEEWLSPAFAAELVDGTVVARGVCDDKSDVMARLHALEAWSHTRGRPPCSIVWLTEGAEEIGSPGLGDLLRAHRDELRADACLWESYLRREDGRPEIAFGCRGLVYVELHLQRLRGDQHSAFATVFRSAAAELVRALATLTDADGIVTIDGFHNDIVPLTADELEALRSIPLPDAAGAALEGSSPFLAGDAAELARRLIAEPTANIAGIVTGYDGPGAKTVLPAEARAKVDFRIVSGQHPQRVVELLREHLDRRGFSDIKIEVLQSVPASKSPIDFPLARAVTQAAREQFGEPVRYPAVPGAGPLHLLEETFGIPTVMPPGSTRMDSGIHAPNEHARVDDYLAQVRFTVRMLELLGQEVS